ncbi:ABC transporter ATP-binding protein [Streptomyces iconiensis]|uniref:ABC transporter ATP-binding protein n=1 Tax=Streptomyces iconiensis TaxID=1384038 RepID=A0ABT7A1I3_9ACTN|nr:ABC transporter ATP-binding protein [Streptomyces iconiensis]MDJ1134473.1 ABC transporter ATP-binding protein [Streptomyces iconiensis]
MPTGTRNARPPALVPLLRGPLGAHRAGLAALVAVQAAQSLALLLLPTLYADVIDHGVLTRDTGRVLRQGGLMLAVTLVQIGSAAAAVHLGARIAMSVGHGLRAQVFARVQRFSGREMARFGPASLLTRTTNDVQQVQMLVFTALTLSLAAPLTGLGGIVLALAQDVPLSLVLIVDIPLLVAVIGFVISRMVPHTRAMRQRLDSVNRVLREQITGARVVRAFVREAHERRRFAEANTGLAAAAVRAGRLQVFFGATATLISTLASVVVVAFAGPRIAEGNLELGSLIAFLNYLALVLASVMVAMTVFMMAPGAKVSAARIGEVLGTEPAVAEPADPAPAPTGPGQLDAGGVTFRYPGAEEPVLHGVDLIARPGQVTAVVGSTGSGKTTLVHLMARLLDADSGTVTLDGTDVRAMRRSDLAAAVGLVPQRAYLFSGTIASNLRYGDPEADDDELWHALGVAQARDFVAALPDGLDTAVGQGGGTVSGGQRQRLALARALVAKPRCYLFDDSFSALDTATEAALRAALDEEIGHTTRLVVSQRVAAVQDADRIAVLDSGRIEATGTHAELLAASPVYAEIVTSQLTSPEAV